MFNDDIGVVILAAGQGKRLGNTQVPKVLQLIAGRPIVSYILGEFSNNNFSNENICLVVGYRKDMVIEEFGSDYLYAEQKELLGTAHAAMTGAMALPGELKNFLVVNGDDSAFYKFETILGFVKNHIENKNKISLLTSELENPLGLGRVLRDKTGRVVDIIEKERLKIEQEKIKEISTGTYCFDREWFLDRYKNLKPIPGLGEYGLPSLVPLALDDGSRFGAYKLSEPGEWFGVNTLEQLKEANLRKTSSKS